MNDLWRYTGELFGADDIDREASAAGVGIDPSTLESAWRAQVGDVLSRAGLTTPDVRFHAALGDGRSRQAYRTPRPHAFRDADCRSLASRCDVVARAVPSREELFAILETVKDP